MDNLLTNFSALTVFLVIAAIGLIFLLVSFIFGEVLDHQIGLDHGLDGAGHAFLDSRAISVFVTAFGGFGAIGIQLGLGVFASSLLGVASGLILGGAVSLFARFLFSQQASSSVSETQLVGRVAQVTVTIAPGGVGQISCRVGEERVEKLARARGTREIKAGTIVRVEELAGDSVIVNPEQDAQSVVRQASEA